MQNKTINDFDLDKIIDRFELFESKSKNGCCNGKNHGNHPQGGCCGGNSGGKCCKDIDTEIEFDDDRGCYFETSEI